MSYYRESQARIDEAESALLHGDEPRARALYREAADLQRAFIDSVAPERVRTRSIYGLSAATLLARAGDDEDAERLACQILAEPWVEAYAADKLRELLDRIWKERRGAVRSPGATEASAAVEPLRTQVSPPGRGRRFPRMRSGPRLDHLMGYRA